MNGDKIILVFLQTGFLAMIIYALYWVSFGQYKKEIMKERCTCGQEKKWCKSYLYTGGGVLFGRADRWECKKSRDSFKKLMESPAIKRIRKEIKENGSSCPENW